MDNENENDNVLAQREARVNVTWSGQNGDLGDPVLFDSTDADVKGWLTEAIAGGSIPGIDPDPNVDLGDFVIDRFAANDEVPYNRIMVRPKTPFGIFG